jgi:hypothetical protein
MFRRISDATVGTMIVLVHVALQAREHHRESIRGSSRGSELDQQRRDRGRLVPHHHVTSTRHDHVPRIS